MTSDDYLGAEIVRHAAERPTAPAIIGPERTIDFASLRRAIEGTAGALHAAGLARGTVAAVTLRNRPRDLIALLALLRLGAPMLPLGPEETAETRRRLAARAGARVIVGEPEDALGGLPVLTLRPDWQDHPPIALPPPPPETISYMMRSSGTTDGVSKIVPTPHWTEVSRNRTTFARFPLGSDDRFLMIMRLSFAVTRGYAMRGLVKGGSVIFPPSLRAVGVLVRAVHAQGATWMGATPVHLRDLMRAATGTPLLPGLKIVCTAAALSPAERQRVMRTLSPQLYVNYGTSEVGNLAMALPEELALGPNIVGQVEPEIEAEAVDDADRPLPPGAVGVLRFRHPRFAMAYLDTGPVATSRFVDGWFYPGDVGVIDADRRVHLHGRVDGMINVGGRMVYPADIENCLHNHPAVRDAVVLGLPSARLGVVPVAIAVVSGDTSEAELRHLCRAHFGELLTPRRIAFVDAIPRTDGGKVDRRALAALARRALDEVDQS